MFQLHCNRVTNWIEDYKNIRSWNITKTCKTYRITVYKSFKKKPRKVKRKNLKKNEQIDLLVILIKQSY